MGLDEFLGGFPLFDDNPEVFEFLEEAIRRASNLETKLDKYESACSSFKKILEQIEEYAHAGYMDETDEIGALFNIRQMALQALGREK